MYLHSRNWHGESLKNLWHSESSKKFDIMKLLKNFGHSGELEKTDFLTVSITQLVLTASLGLTHAFTFFIMSSA